MRALAASTLSRLPSRRALLGSVLTALLLALVLPDALPAQAPAPAAPLPAFDFLYGDRELYPSALICLAGSAPKAPRDDDQLGDKTGVLSVRLRSPAPGTRVRVTINETPLWEESRADEILPAGDTIYRVAPLLRYRTDVLAGLRQPIANLVVRAVIEFPGATHEIAERLVVHSINDTVARYRLRLPEDEPEQWNLDAKYLIAAFVNENHPWIDQSISRHALQRRPQPYVGEFAGYSGGRVEDELRAIYETLRDFGFKYSQFPGPSTQPVGPDHAGRIVIQSIRLFTDTLLSTQANETETALVMASVLRKLGVDCVIILRPPRTLLGVYLKPGRRLDSLLVLEPRAVGTGDFATAKAGGAELFTDEIRDRLFPAKGTSARELRLLAERNRVGGYFAIDIREARELGVLPIPDVPPPGIPAPLPR